MTNNVRNAGYLIFPRDDMEFALNIPISAAQIEEAREAHRKNFGLEDDYEIRHFMVRVVGVLKYWGNAPEPYHLSFIFSLLERPHSALRPGVSLKQEQLLLERTGWRDIIAT